MFNKKILFKLVQGLVIYVFFATNAFSGADWNTQKEKDVIAHFQGCKKQSPTNVICAVTVTNDSVEKKSIRVGKKQTALLEATGDIYRPENLRVKDDLWKVSFTRVKLSPGRSVTFEFSFDVKKNANQFDEFTIKLNRSVGYPEFVFHPK